jgi:hypothetical protein
VVAPTLSDCQARHSHHGCKNSDHRSVHALSPLLYEPEAMDNFLFSGSHCGSVHLGRESVCAECRLGPASRQRNCAGGLLSASTAWTWRC